MSTEDGPRPEDEHAVARALRAAIPTSRHAEMLFDMVVHTLGAEAVVWVNPSGTARKLFRKEAAPSNYVVPWPLLTLSLAPDQILEGFFPGFETVEPVHRPEIAPKLRGLQPGRLTMHDGAGSLRVGYREDGLWKETCRSGPPETLAALIDALTESEGIPTERVADFVVGLDITRHGPGRVVLPAAVPAGPDHVWSVGLRALRGALHDSTIPTDAHFALVDGVRGTHLAHGATLDEVTRRWFVEVETMPLMAPGTEPMPTSEDLGMEPWTSEAQAHDEAAEARREHPPVLWPALTIKTIPWALITLEPCPHPEHPWGRWTRVLDPHGRVVFALQRPRPGGFTLVGADVLPHVDLERLESALDRADEDAPQPPHTEGEAWRGEADPYPCVTTTYRVLHERTGEPLPPTISQVSRTASPQAGTLLDGKTLEQHVIRVRRD